MATTSRDIDKSGAYQDSIRTKPIRHWRLRLPTLKTKDLTLKQQDKPRLVKLLLRLQAVFPKEINELTYEAYFEALAIYKIEYVEKIGIAMIRSESRFPLPTDFLDALKAYAWTDRIYRDMREENLIDSGVLTRH